MCGKRSLVNEVGSSCIRPTHARFRPFRFRHAGHSQSAFQKCFFFLMISKGLISLNRKEIQGKLSCENSTNPVSFVASRLLSALSGHMAKNAASGNDVCE